MPTETGETFGQRLRLYRLRAGLTQEKLAERAQISPRGLMYLEQDQRRPQPDTARRLAEAMGLTEEERDIFMGSAVQDRSGAASPAPRGERSPRRRAVPARMEAEPVGAAVTPSKRRASVSGGVVGSRVHAGRRYALLLVLPAAALVVALLLSTRRPAAEPPVPQVGRPVLGWGQTATRLTHFKRPSDVAVGPSGDVFVADTGNDRVVELSPAGSVRHVYVTAGLIGPRRIAVGPDGVIYASGLATATTMHAALWVHFPGRTSVGYFPSTLDGTPSAMVADAPGRLDMVATLFTAMYGGASPTFDAAVARYAVSPNSMDLLSFVDAGVSGSPCGNEMALMPGGHLLVSQHWCTAAKTTARELSVPGTLLRRLMLRGDSGLAVSTSGNIYIADMRRDMIRMYSATGQNVRSWKVGPLRGTVRLAVDPAGNVYVATSGSNRVLKLGRNGGKYPLFGQKAPPARASPPPAHVAIGARGTVFVGDSSTRIHAIGPNGRMDAIWDTYCGQTGESAPGPVPYTDARGGLYIRSAGGPAVERYAENGNCLGLVLLPGSGSGALFGLGPGKRFFSAGPYPTAIQESDAEGRILQTFGRVCRAQSCSLTAGEIHVPDGDQRIVAVGHGGSVFVLDQNAGAIVKFSRDGQVLDVIGKSGSAPGQMRNPTSITVDARGYLYVADTGNNRIEKFSPQGHVVAATGRFGTGPGRFNTPTDIAVDGGGNVYVIDLRNRRLQKFVPLR